MTHPHWQAMHNIGYQHIPSLTDVKQKDILTKHYYYFAFSQEPRKLFGNKTRS